MQVSDPRDRLALAEAYRHPALAPMPNGGTGR
jgi:hypothetical protein